MRPATELPELFVGTVNGSPHAIQGLRHTVVNDIAFCARDDECAELVKRANAYPELVAALHRILMTSGRINRSGDILLLDELRHSEEQAKTLLDKLGEDK